MVIFEIPTGEAVSQKDTATLHAYDNFSAVGPTSLRAMNETFTQDISARFEGRHLSFEIGVFFRIMHCDYPYLRLARRLSEERPKKPLTQQSVIGLVEAGRHRDRRYLLPMRSLIALLLTTLPAQAWIASNDGPVCTLIHSEAVAGVVLTYDPSGPLYSIAITRDVPWPDAPVFAMRFEGAAGLTITTDRHQTSPDGLTLTVTDRGFGNVLNGLSQNQIAVAQAGDAVVAFDLSGAAPAVAVFETCGATPSV